MGRRDVINYYISVQEQYFEMLNDVKDLDEAYSNGLINQDTYEQAQDLIVKTKDNYERLSYIVLLLNEPNRKSNKAKYKKQNSKVYDYLKNSDSCYIKNENDDVLKKLKEIDEGVKHGQ